MSVTAIRAERGQTVPVWVLAILVSLTLTFFVVNYANTVKWQIHAQNAADSAAAAALGNDAAALNSVQSLLAAFDIQELKVRDVAAAVPSLLLQAPCSSTNLLTQSCTSNLTAAAGDLANSVNTLSNVANTLNEFQGKLTDNVANPAATVNSFFAPNGSGGCSINVLTDCDFTYTTYLTYGANGLPTVDEYACKKIANVAAAFLHLGVGTYYAIGHTTQTIAPVNALYSPATLGSGFVTTASVFPDVTGSAIVGDLSGLSVNSGIFAAVGAPPPSTTHHIADVCPG